MNIEDEIQEVLNNFYLAKAANSEEVAQFMLKNLGSLLIKSMKLPSEFNGYKVFDLIETGIKSYNPQKDGLFINHITNIAYGNHD